MIFGLFQKGDFLPDGFFNCCAAANHFGFCMQKATKFRSFKQPYMIQQFNILLEMKLFFTLLVLFHLFSHIEGKWTNKKKSKSAAVDPDYELKVSPPINFTSTFPPSLQKSNRILASITVAFQGRLYFLERQLTQFVQACEHGFEVHVLIVSRVDGWDKLPILNTPGLFRCNRLRTDIPIQVFSEPPVKERLAFYHRPIFLQLKYSYDYFVNQEDDILITAANLNYFVRYEGKMRGSGILPTFAMYEIPYQFPVPQDTKKRFPLLQNRIWPRAWETSTYMLKISAHIVKFEEEYIMLPYKTYCASYMIPQWVLEKYSQYPAWLGDENKPWWEYNVHFAHQWLNRYFFLGIPISSWFERAFVHHGPNRYINEIFTKEKPGLGKFDLFGSDHGFSVDVDEVSDFLNQAFGRSPIVPNHGHPGFTRGLDNNNEVLRPWTLNITYVTFGGQQIPTNDILLPLKECVDSNHTARIEPNFLGKFPDAFYERKATVRVKFQCVKNSEVPTQEVSTCKKADKPLCDSGFGPDAKSSDLYHPE